MRSSFMALAIMLGGACGRDALVDVPPGASATDGGPVPQTFPTNPTGGGAGGAGGAAGAGGSVPDAARPGPPGPIVDARAPSAPDSTPIACTDVPGCLQKLAFTCPTTGACMVARNGQTTNQCYTATMVKVSTNISGQGVSARVIGPDGKLCYTLVVTQGRGGMGGQGAMVTYSDINAQPVATGTLQGAGRVTLACTSGGAPAIVMLACAPGASALAGLAGIGGMNACTNGPCTP